jgi:hypothetical protein
MLQVKVYGAERKRSEKIEGKPVQVVDATVDDHRTDATGPAGRNPCYLRRGQPISRQFHLLAEFTQL